MRKLLLIALAAIESLSYAFIDHINVMYNPTINQTVYLIGDIHLPSKIAARQRSELLWFLKMLENNTSDANQGVYCIVEDILTANHEHPVVAQYIKATKRQSPHYWYTQLLTGFAEDCKKRAIACCNIEHRQLTTFSFSGWPINANTVIDQYYTVFDTMCSFDISPTYNQIFQEQLTKYEQTVFTHLKPYLETLRSDDIPFGQMVKNSPYDPCIDQIIEATNPGYPVPEEEFDRKRFLFDFCDVSWPELLIANEIGMHPHIKNIVVIAGGGHTIENTAILKKAGFHMQCQYQASVPIEDIAEDALTIDMHAFMHCHTPKLTSAKVCKIPQGPPNNGPMAGFIWAFLCSLLGTFFAYHMLTCPAARKNDAKLDV